MQDVTIFHVMRRHSNATMQNTLLHINRLPVLKLDSNEALRKLINTKVVTGDTVIAEDNYEKQEASIHF